MKIVASGTEDRRLVQSAAWTQIAVFDDEDGLAQELLVPSRDAADVALIFYALDATDVRTTNWERDWDLCQGARHS